MYSIFLLESEKYDPIKSFHLKKDLNRKIWEENDKINPEIRSSLIRIAEDFIENLEVNIKVKEIMLTGSLANYNWSEYSDFDLHIIFDFKDVNEDKELVRKYLDAESKLWEFKHDIEIEGYSVEIYAEDHEDIHNSTGQYSLKKDEWIIKPKRSNFKLDEDLIIKKSESIMETIEEIEEDYKEGYSYDDLAPRIKKIWKKIKQGRKAGLEKEGEYSVENLVFKLLRRNGYIEKLINIRTKSYDKQF